jgi:DNA-binding HxlR family transcriptional regulator
MFNVPVTVLSIETLGYLDAVLLAHINSYWALPQEKKTGNRNLWVPEIEVSFPVSIKTINASIRRLLAKGLIEYYDVSKQPYSVNPDEGYILTSTGTELVTYNAYGASKPFIRVPAFHSIPKGRLLEIIILSRVMSTKLAYNVIGIRRMSKQLHINTHTITNALRELENAGLLSQESNIRTLKDTPKGFKNTHKKSSTTKTKLPKATII